MPPKRKRRVGRPKGKGVGRKRKRLESYKLSTLQSKCRKRHLNIKNKSGKRLTKKQLISKMRR